MAPRRCKARNLETFLTVMRLAIAGLDRARRAQLRQAIPSPDAGAPLTFLKKVVDNYRWLYILQATTTDCGFFRSSDCEATGSGGVGLTERRKKNNREKTSRGSDG